MGARTLFIGLGGQNAGLIDAQIREGSTPRLAAILGGLGRVSIDNYPGLGDGGFWPSAATGADPSRHGRYFMMQFDPATYQTYKFDESRHFRSHAFWQDLDAEGRRVCIVDWPRAPFSRIDNGVLLDNWLQHDPPTGPRSFPADLAGEIIARYGADPFGAGLHTHPLTSREDFDWAIASCRSRIAAKTRFAVDRLMDDDWDLFALVYPEPHDLGHYAYHLHDGSHPKFDTDIAAAVGDPLRQIGAALDAAIAEIVDAAGPNCEATLLSGPGMAPLVSGNTVMDTLTRRLDLGVSDEATPAAIARNAYRAAMPYAFRRALSPLKRLIMGEPPNPEYRRRRFFSVPHADHTGCIRINLKGRECAGIISPGEEYANVIDALIRDIRDIRDSDTGEPVVGEIVKTSEIYNGPAMSILPDLFLHWRRSRPFRRISSPKIGHIEVPDREMRTGDHTQEGAFWAPHARIAELTKAQPVRPHEVAGVILASARRP